MIDRRVGGLSAPWKVVLIVLPFVVAFAALCIGRIPLTPADVFRSILSAFGADVETGAQSAQILWTMRLPRILLAALVGAGLSVAGCAFQSLFSNPLATPDTLGVASGSSFGAALAILFGFGLLGIQLTALVCGIIAVALTYLSGSGKGRNVNSYVLSGIMIGSLFTALVSLVKYTADTESQLPSITYWLMGSLNGKGYQTLTLGAPLILIGISVLFLLRWRLNILPLSTTSEIHRYNIRALRVVVVLCPTANNRLVRSMCGRSAGGGLCRICAV